MISPYMISSIFQINAIAPCILSKMVLPHIKKTRGSIVFISSSMGFRGLPFTSVYCSTKMSLTALAGALRIEHHWDPIHIGIAYVGPTENDQDKTVMNGDGSPLFLGAMKGF